MIKAMRTYTVSESNIIVDCPGFDLELTLDCGQAFRRPLECSQDAHTGTVTLFNVTEAEFLTKWDRYFDFCRDYESIKNEFASDSVMKAAIDYCGGIRLLLQDTWETLVSFIVSQNNNIPRIKLIIGRLYDHYGHFPTAADLAHETPETLDFAKAGFRAKYLIGSAKMVLSREINLDELAKMPTCMARLQLQKLPGVGPKVAECTLLYGYGRLECFPVDVWIKKALAEFYPDGFPFAGHPYAGIAQQFLFHYIRRQKREDRGQINGRETKKHNGKQLATVTVIQERN
jgi:N-glycosylase/DNA lyase